MSRRYPSHPRVAVGVVVWRNERVLLIRRATPPKQGEWSLPGGTQKLGETVFETGRREVAEETGLKVDIGGLVDVVDYIDHDSRGAVRYHYTLVDLWAEAPAGDPVAAADADDARWFSLDELRPLALWDETERVIRLARQKRENS